MMTTRMVRSSSLFKQLGPRLFSSSALTGSGGGVLVSPMRSPAMCVRAFPVRFASGAAANSASIGQEERESEAKKEAATVPAGQRKVASYWGITPSKIAKEDGTEWRWHCFKPWDTYKSDLSIDLKKHHVPTTFFDKVALWTVKSLRVPTDIFFQELEWSVGCSSTFAPSVALSTVVVGFGPSLKKQENERMHLMTFMEVAKPRWYERALVITVQGIFFNAYFLGYLISPKFAHRVVGYLEEEAVHSYTEFLKELDKGNIENVPAPAIAINYWRLPADATLRDVVVMVV